MLSLGKLTQLAQMDQSSLRGEDAQRELEGKSSCPHHSPEQRVLMDVPSIAIDDTLDVVRTQESLAALFSERLSGSESRLSVYEQGRAIAERIAPALHDRPMLAERLASACGSLFAGHVLSTEDLIDVLSLKENVNEQAGDFGMALDVLVRAKDLPEARRRSALAGIWRRVYIQDEYVPSSDVHNGPLR